MFVLDSLSLVEHLTPAVFTGGLHTEHCQIFCREYNVVVALGIGKEEVGLVVVLSDGLLLEYLFINYSWYCLENVNNVGGICKKYYLCNQKDG